MAEQNANQNAGSDSADHIGDARTNSTKLGKSNVNMPMKGRDVAYLHMGTGEIVVIPKKAYAAFRNEYTEVSNAVAEYHSANRVICALKEYREYSATMTRNWLDSVESRTLDKVLAEAFAWQSEAHKKYHDLFGELKLLPDDEKEGEGKDGKKKEEKAEPKLKDMSGRLIELVTLGEIKDPDERRKKKAEMNKGTWDPKSHTYAKKFLGKGAKLKDLGKYPKEMPEIMIYVRHDKVKWPELQTLENKGWKEVIAKDKNGKRSLDKAALKSYVAKKAADGGVGWLKAKFEKHLKLEDRTGTFMEDSFWVFKLCDRLNQKWKTDKNGKFTWDGKQLADVNLTAKAQLMRYTYGGSLDPDVSFSEGHISVRAEGHAELDIAEADAKLTLNFPGKTGWVWTFKKKPIVAIRLDVELGASAVVGASIAVELSVETSVKKVGDPVAVKGAPGPTEAADRDKGTVDVKKDQQARAGKLDGKLSVFAGAKAEGTITGSLLWRDPESEKKDFGAIATISAGVTGMAGLGLDAEFAIEYVSGMFRVTAHAHLCFGLGCGGLVTFNVDKGQVEDFCKHVFYNLMKAQFSEEIRELEILRDTGFRAVKALQGLVALHGKEAYASYYGLQEVFLTREWQTQFASLNASQLAGLARSAPEVLKYALPEVKGALLCAMCNVASTDPALVPVAKQAALAVLKTNRIKPESRNTVQHMTSDGSKGLFEDGMELLNALFRKGVSGLGGLGGLGGVDGLGGWGNLR